MNILLQKATKIVFTISKKDLFVYMSVLNIKISFLECAGRSQGRLGSIWN